jgi:cell division protein FtsQ
MHQLIDKKKKILIYIVLLIILSTTSNISLENQKNTFASINTINVSGLSNNTNLEIAQKLNHLLFKNIFFINKDKINKIILKYNVIEKYSVKKIYPKRINIKIKATKYIAEIKSDKKFLVGSNGKLISSEFNNEVLPLFFGKFNSEKFLEFKKFVDKSKFKFKDFKSILFYSSSRWDIQTINGIMIKLPRKNLDQALGIAYKIIKDDEFKDSKVIDLRITNHVIIKNEK